MLPTTLENAGLQEPVKKSCVATVTKGGQLDEDRGQESDQEEEPPDTLGAHLPAPQREADEPRSGRRSRGQDEEGRQYIGASASSTTSQDEDQDPC
ncbi:unnamed protein product, partial [Ascophyllum nodosum]